MKKVKWLLFVALFLFCIRCDEDVEVFIIPHSHTDAGWFLTYNQYYEGKIVEIFNSILSVLPTNPSYRYNWADTNFLAKFYRETSEEKRVLIHKLVENGQIGFMGGGWVMHDETLPDYRNELLQMETGLRWLNETFGVRPRVGWQI